MAKQETEQEPSIEEILSSIRQIISDDDDEGAGTSSSPAAKAPEPVIHEDADDDVIELTQKIEDDSSSFSQMVDDFSAEAEEPPIEVAMRDAEKEAPADFFAEPEEELQQVVTPSAPPRPAPVSRSAEDEDSILTRGAEEAAYSGFAELARRTAIEHGGITLEEIVRSELKPLLRDWLNRNLPSIIERLVGEELERVAKRALEE